MFWINANARIRQGAALSLVGLFAAIASADSLEIKRKFEPGSERYVEHRLELTQTIKGGAMGEAKVKLNRVFGLWETEEKTSDGNHAIVLTFDRLAQDMDVPNIGTHQYDTDDPQDDEAAWMLKPIFDAIAGNSMRLVLDDDLNVVSFSGIDEISRKVSSEAAGNLIWAQMREEFTNEAGRRTWGEEQFLVLPNKEVKVGETWEKSMTEDHARIGKVVTRLTCKLERVENLDSRESAIISFSGTVGSEKEGSDEAAAPRVSGTTSGEAVYDVRAGKIRSSKSLTDLNISIGGPGAPSSMTVHVGAKSSKKAMSPKEREAQKPEATKKAEQRKQAQKTQEADENK